MFPLFGCALPDSLRSTATTATLGFPVVDTVPEAAAADELFVESATGDAIIMDKLLATEESPTPEVLWMRWQGGNRHIAE
jgi:hypothetical protein